MNIAGCPALATKPENRVWFRASQPVNWTTALQTSHTTRTPSRFSTATKAKPTFQIMYLAEDHVVALYEVGALLGSPFTGKNVPYPHNAWTILNVHVTLQYVADLTLAPEQAKIATTAQELTGDWEANSYRTPQSSVNQPTGFAPTQLLGQTLFQMRGLEGFRTISAKRPTHMSLVIFPSKLRAGSSIVFHNLATNQKHSIRPRGKIKRAMS